MNELLNTDQLNLLARALRQKSFHFIIVGYDSPDIYTEISAWMNEHLSDRQIRQLSVSGKSFQEIRNFLIEADHDVVIIPDFDWFFKADNAGICVAFNQHRDFFARRKMTLLCFIQSLNFRLLPLKMPDLWSLRSLELEFTQFQQAEEGFKWSNEPGVFVHIQPEKLGLGNRLGFSPMIPIEVAELKAVHSNDKVDSDLHKEMPDVILSLDTLEEAEKTLLSVFAVLPAEPITFTVLDDLLPGIGNLDKILLNLAKKKLIDFNASTESFKCSSFVQEGTRRQNKEQLFEHCKLLINTLIEKLGYESTIGHLEHVTYETGMNYVRYSEGILNWIDDTHYEKYLLSERIGNFHNMTGNLDNALIYYELSNKLMQKLYDTYPENASFKNGLAVSYQNIGNTHFDFGNYDKALIYYEEFAVLSKELYDAYPENPFFKNGRAISYSKLGETHIVLGHLDTALTNYEYFNQLMKELYDTYPDNVFFKYGLAVSYCAFGITYSQLGNYDKALTFYEDYLRLSQELYEASPNNVSFKNNLAISYKSIGVFYWDHFKDTNNAYHYFHQAETLWVDLLAASPANTEFQSNLTLVKNAMKNLQSHD